MLPKSKRLRAVDFKAFRGAAALHSPHFLCRVRPDTAFRAAAVVSAAVAKKAVDRNRLRRRIYAMLEKSTSPCALLTITAKKGATGLSFADIQGELGPLLQKVSEIS